jgi:hypothetical protein
MSLGLSEILKKASDIESKEDRIKYLQSMSSIPMFRVVKAALDPNVKWLVGPELPNFNACKLPGQEEALLAESRRLYLFLEGGHDTLAQHKRETLFIQFLEMLSPEDVELIRCALQKKLPYDNLTYDVMNSAYPMLLPSALTDVEVKKEPKKKKEKVKAAVEPIKVKKEPKKKGAKKVKK